jgi:hypothetical protein
MSGFFGQIFRYLANEVVVEQLAKSPTFQRFALRTDARMQAAQKKSEELLKSVGTKGEEYIAKQKGGAPESEFGKFWKEFTEEIQSTAGETGKIPRPKK